MGSDKFYSKQKIINSMEEKNNLKFEKVIFLDMDGVLNDAYFPYLKDSYLNRDMVKRLKHIIDETGAEIVLISSWRSRLRNYLNNECGCESEEERIELVDNKDGRQILKILGEFGIMPRETTDIILFSGSDARPLEIRTWLTNKKNVKRFVILDDDSSWNWNWLKNFLVLTRREKHDEWYGTPSGNYIRGLDDEHAEEAIRILNSED